MAKKAKRKVTPAKVGRPSPYEPGVYPEQARKLCLLGATDAEMAEFFGVSEVTINAWKKAHPEFLKSIKESKLLADGDVASRLYERAMGYSHDAVKIFLHEGNPVTVDFTEHYPPDATSMIFWLKNRQSAKWRDKIEHEGQIGISIVPVDAGRPPRAPRQIKV